MLGLGSNLTKGGAGAKTIITDGLVLKHNYAVGAVQPLSDGAAAINADANGTDFIDVGLIPITTNDVTISAWVYITDFINGCAIFSNRHGSSPNQGFAIRTAESPDKFQIITDEATTGSATTSSSAKNTNQWYHVCAVLDRDGSQYLYVDGVLEGSTDISGLADSLTHTTSARIGKNFSSYEMNGYICNVGYWNATLSQPQIKSIMNKNYAGLSDSEKTDLVSWWNLDSTIPELTTAVYDNHHGGGEVLGSNAVINEDFGVDDNWTQGTGWDIDTVNNKATCNNTSGSTQNLETAARITTLAGKTAILEFTVSDYSGSASMIVTLEGTGANDFSGVNSNGTYSKVIKVGTSESSIDLFFKAADGWVGSISNVSLKPINGNTGTLS